MRFALFLLLFGCVATPAVPVYEVTLDLVHSQAEIDVKCGREVLGTVRGCVTPGCRIVALEPRSFDDQSRLETLGHELWHCVKGPEHT